MSIESNVSLVVFCKLKQFFSTSLDVIASIKEIEKYHLKMVLVSVDQHGEHNEIFCLYWYFNSRNFQIQKKLVDFEILNILSEWGVVFYLKYWASNILPQEFFFKFESCLFLSYFQFHSFFFHFRFWSSFQIIRHQSHQN